MNVLHKYFESMELLTPSLPNESVLHECSQVSNYKVTPFPFLMKTTFSSSQFSVRRSRSRPLVEGTGTGRTTEE